MAPHQLPESIFALIVGCGPVAILSALGLARYGYDSVIVERYPTRLGQPKAHVLNPRAIEVLRQYDLDVPLLRKKGLSPEEADGIHFDDSVQGIEYGRFDGRT
jgi:2-polyprenyl-6-methoxyphenol hydroxylase-like FAD-dependent oxidoreductase